VSSGVASPSKRSATAATLAYIGPLSRIWLSETGLIQRPLLQARKVQAFTWSPDGRRIAFLSSGSLHVINADGSRLRRLLAKPILLGFAWSPDSRRIAYTGAEGSDVHLYVVSASGGAPKVLAPAVVAAVLPSWSRRGTIAFTSARTTAARIYSIEPDGSGFRTLTRGASDSFPSWSPDGRLLLFQRYECPSRVCGYGIYVMRPDGSGRRRLVHLPRTPGGGGVPIAWSPDSRRIAFARPRDPGVGDEILVTDADGRHPRNLTKGNREASHPSWSPDGGTIAYESGSSIYLMNADGSGKRLFVESGGQPAWQPRR
jgi:TolB protein